MNYHIIVQNASSVRSIPSTKEFKHWAKMALKNKTSKAEVTIRIVDAKESRKLNHTYRSKNKPTNVLSFPYEPDNHIKIPILGDLVICAEVVKKEARNQKKRQKAHWAHMVIHGILHLLGYDHEKEKEAEIMENEEISILKSLGISNPYHVKKGK